MTETIGTLRGERDRLLARLAQLDRLLSQYEEWEREAADVLSGTAQAAPSQSPTAAIEAKERGSTLREFEVAATKIFETVESPLQRAEAFARLAEAGIVVVGKEPLNVMTTRFNRMDNIINLRGHGYWLKGRPYPPADYPAPAGGNEQRELSDRDGSLPFSDDGTTP